MVTRFLTQVKPCKCCVHTMKLLAIAVIGSNVTLEGMEKAFLDGKQVAEKASKDKKVNESSVTLVPQFQDGVRIDQSETSKAFEYLEKNENARAVKEIHEERSIYIVDEKEPFMERAENIHKDPNKHLEESDEFAGGSNKFSIEYCEECPDEEYMVTARKTKKRYVYLQTPPYITAGHNCDNHGWLSIRAEIVNEPEAVFREDGKFENIKLIRKTQNDAVISECYSVNGVQIELKKTIYQNGSPWIRPDCYLVPALQGNVVDSADLIRKLLSGANDEDMWWGCVPHWR